MKYNIIIIVIFYAVNWQTLAGFSDVDNFCDVVDALEEQGIEKHMDVSPSTATSTVRPETLRAYYSLKLHMTN